MCFEDLKKNLEAWAVWIIQISVKPKEEGPGLCRHKTDAETGSIVF